MSVDQFLSTYKKDYLWPNVKNFGIKTAPVQISDAKPKPACPCRCRKEEIAHIDAPASRHEEWSREGPMGKLLEPTLYYPVKNGTPSSDVGRYAQPNVFLDKLQQKYPFIYECLKAAPPDDLLSRINKERLTSTYQVDYGKMREYPDGPYDELVRAAGVHGQQLHSEPARLPNNPYRPRQKTSLSDKKLPCPQKRTEKLLRKNLRPIALRPGLISNEDGRRKNEQIKKKRAGITDWSPFATNPDLNCDKLIKKWGQMVSRDLLHAHGPKSSGRTTCHK